MLKRTLNTAFGLVIQKKECKESAFTISFMVIYARYRLVRLANKHRRKYFWLICSERKNIAK